MAAERRGLKGQRWVEMAAGGEGGGSPGGASQGC